MARVCGNARQRQRAQAQRVQRRTEVGRFVPKVAVGRQNYAETGRTHEHQARPVKTSASRHIPRQFRLGAERPTSAV